MTEPGLERPYFDTTSVRAELRTRTVRSVFSAVTGRGLSLILNLVSVTVLARLLVPADFGVIAMVTPVATVASMTLNLGINFALLHEEDVNDVQITRLFWIAQASNVVTLGAMALLAPMLVWLYREPRVAAVTMIWAVSLGMQGLGAAHEAILKRQLRFGWLTFFQVGGLALGVVLAIVAASRGAKHLALMLPIVAADVARGAGAWMLCSWRPRWVAPRNWLDPAVHKLVSYGSHLSAYRGIYWAGRQADRFIVGYIAGASTAGLYDSARRWSWYPFQELFQSLTDVAVASLSRARADAERFRMFWRRGLTAFLALPLPATAFIFVEADHAVRVVLGARWLDAVPLVRIMCISAFIGSVSRLTMWVYTAEGRTQQQLRWGLITTPVMLTCVVIGATRGATGVAWAFAIGVAILTIPTLAYCLRGSALTWGDFGAAVWRPVVSSLVAAAVSVSVRPVVPVPGFLIAEFVL
ncbi:MAG: lipopolysaccharide biosynthesis protein, partial [Gemmatimonadota bacterium]